MQDSLISYRGSKPKLAPDVFVAPGAFLIGDVEIGEGSSIWFNSVVRGDVTPIYIGSNTNIQDGCTLHGAQNPKFIPVKIGSNVTVGHNAILHACTVEDKAFIGMGAIVLSGAVIGEGAVVAAGALIPEGKEIPPGSLVMGTPGRVVRQVTPQEKERFSRAGIAYISRAREYKAGS